MSMLAPSIWRASSNGGCTINLFSMLKDLEKPYEGFDLESVTDSLGSSRLKSQFWLLHKSDSMQISMLQKLREEIMVKLLMLVALITYWGTLFDT